MYPGLSCSKAVKTLSLITKCQAKKHQNCGERLLNILSYRTDQHLCCVKNYSLGMVCCEGFINVNINEFFSLVQKTEERDINEPLTLCQITLVPLTHHSPLPKLHNR